MKYTTNSIDEVAYLALKGHEYKSKRLGEVRGVWTFERTKQIDIHRKQFWGGNATVNLHKWLSLRNIVKAEQKKMPINSKAPDMTATNPLGLINGESYYFCNQSKNVQQALFGDAEIHKKRILQGNFYKTREEAELALVS